jgi:putative addiction module component (TIGR02574 family)
MASREQIVQEALSLAPEDRAFVADALEQSLSSGSFATPEIAAAWAHEIERRLAAYDRGEINAIDADAALIRIRQQLAERRSQKEKS